MNAEHALLLIGVVAAGVALPKALPAAVVAGTARGRWGRFLALLPAATLAALAMLTAVQGPGGLGPRPHVLFAVAVAAVAAALTHRTLLAMVAGWAAALGAAVLVG